MKARLYEYKDVILASSLTVCVLLLTISAALPEYSNFPSPWFSMTETMGQGNAWGTQLYPFSDHWFFVNITSEVPLTIIIIEIEGENYTLSNVTTLEWEVHQGTELIIWLEESGTFHIEVLNMMTFSHDNTQTLDESPWFIFLCFSTLVVNIHVLRERSIPSSYLFMTCIKLMFVMLLPFYLSLNNNSFSYNSTLLNVHIFEDGNWIQGPTGPSIIILMVLFLTPFIFVDYKLRTQSGFKSVLWSSLITVIVLLLILFIPIHPRYETLWQSFLPWTLVFFLLSPLLFYISLQMSSDMTSRTQRLILPLLAYLSVFCPYVMNIYQPPLNITSTQLIAPLWQFTLHIIWGNPVFTELFFYVPTRFSFLLALLPPIFLFLFVYSVLRCYGEMVRKKRTLVYGFLGVILSWLMIYIFPENYLNIPPSYVRAFCLLIPVPMLLLVGLVIVYFIKPVDSMQFVIDTTEVEEDEIEVPLLYRILYRLKKSRYRMKRK